MRQYKRVCVFSWYDEKEYYTLPVATIEELKKFNPRYLLSKKPRGLSEFDDDYYFDLSLPNGQLIDNRGWVAVRSKDYKDLLASLPHIPNKKEAKALRKAKIKQGK